jgi:hypothetical protein
VDDCFSFFAIVLSVLFLAKKDRKYNGKKGQKVQWQKRTESTMAKKDRKYNGKKGQKVQWQKRTESTMAKTDFAIVLSVRFNLQALIASLVSLNISSHFSSYQKTYVIALHINI